VRVYLAGPLFTPYERDFLAGCAARIREAGIEVFVPHEHALADADTRPAAIFEQDFAGLAAADAVCCASGRAAAAVTTAALAHTPTSAARLALRSIYSSVGG
jgi:DNA-binding LacI/PurR family transcriptional regulator